jgi:hypothetical protein
MAINAMFSFGRATRHPMEAEKLGETQKIQSQEIRKPSRRTAEKI